MQRVMLKSKIHRATVTDCDLHYVGSITIDPDTFDPVADVDGQALVAVAARVGDVRLIDNTLIGRQ